MSFINVASNVLYEELELYVVLKCTGKKKLCQNKYFLKIYGSNQIFKLIKFYLDNLD